MHYFGAEEEEPGNAAATFLQQLLHGCYASEGHWYRHARAKLAPDPARRRASEYCRSADSGRNGSKAAQRTVPLTPDAAVPVSGSAQFGWRIDLGPTQYRLLQHFLRNPERVFSRQQLLEIIWPHNEEVELRTAMSWSDGYVWPSARAMMWSAPSARQAIRSRRPQAHRHPALLLPPGGSFPATGVSLANGCFQPGAEIPFQRDGIALLSRKRRV